MRGSYGEGLPGKVGVETPVMRPKLALFKLTTSFVGSRLAWLMTLKASKRASIWSRSLIGKNRLTAVSTLTAPGACAALRERFPKVPGADGVKAALFNT